jgi:hypothetical protein
MLKIDENLTLLIIKLIKSIISKVNKLDQHIRHSNTRSVKCDISKALISVATTYNNSSKIHTINTKQFNKYQ